MGKDFDRNIRDVSNTKPVVEKTEERKPYYIRLEASEFKEYLMRQTALKQAETGERVTMTGYIQELIRADQEKNKKSIAEN